MLESLNVPWLNGRSSMRYAGNRLRHLKAAQDEGFSVPDTILTSDISAARQFAASHTAVVVKTIHSNVVVDDGQQRCIYTTKVDSAAFANVKEIRSSPMIVQRYIEKTVDIRVVVTGQAAFAIQIDSKDDPAVGCDWRAGSIRRQTHRRHELPISLERACIRLTHRLGLVFSAIDLCVSSNGEYIFFEVNPNGQWAWLETHVGIPIADSLVACARAGLKAWPPSLLS
jgi:glutathione synthase/RimK-type ligase-like ATP-grasp enzyme